METIKTRSMGSHQSARSNTNDWFTPKWIIEALGDFDTDPCTHVNRPWDTAKIHYTQTENGLIMPWKGRVWLNPPYSNRLITPFLEIMYHHRNGIALVFARTDRKDFHQYIYSSADSVLHIKGRLTFCGFDGKPAGDNGGAPSMLVAYTQQDSYALADSRITGAHLPVGGFNMIVITASPSWRNVISIALSRFNGEASLKQIYEAVEVIACDKVKKNSHWKEKVRQKLQLCFNRVREGYYSHRSRAVA